MKGHRVKIIRHLSNGPKMHDVVEFGDLVYVAGMTSDEEGIAAQTRDVLRKIDEKLAVAGSDKNHILRATIYLRDIAHWKAMNGIWEEWMSTEHAPARATVEASLARDNLLIEIVVDAVKKRG